MTFFDKAFDKLIGHEGGYVNNPADPGGETRYGISKASYPNVDIKGLTLEGAKAIYQRDYWAKIGGDALPPVVAYVAFDAAVNNGAGRAAKWLQAALGVAQDGAIGPATLAAAHAKDPVALATEFTAQRLWFMTKLNTWPTFGLGWSRRLSALPYEAAAIAA